MFREIFQAKISRNFTTLFLTPKLTPKFGQVLSNIALELLAWLARK